MWVLSEHRKVGVNSWCVPCFWFSKLYCRFHFKMQGQILKVLRMLENNLKFWKFDHHDHVDAEMLKWFKQWRSSHIPLSGPFLKEKVTEFLKFVGLDFTGSNAWLNIFKASHSISFVNTIGKAKSVDCNATSDWVTESLNTGQSSEHCIQAKTSKIMIKLDCFTNLR